MPSHSHVSALKPLPSIPPNTTTPEQDGWLSALRETPAEVYLWTPDHWQVITQILGR